VGETDVKAWVAFDPFDHTNLAGRTLTVGADSTLADYLQQSRLPLTGCTSETEAHAENCETALELQASPGRDVVMTSSKLSSTVAVLELLAFVPEYTETTMTDDDGNVIDLVQPEPLKPLSTSPHFIVNADLKVFGLDGSAGDAVEDGALALNFAIRPLVLSADETDLPAELRDWLPLFAEVQDEPRAGEEPTINLLEEEFMKSMVGSQALVRTSPIFITGDAEFMIGRGSWADFDLFELRVCAAADFAEAGVDEDATANNCVITPVVVLRKVVTDNPVMGEGDDEVAAATYTDGIRLGDTYGNPDKVAVEFTLRGELISASDGVAAGALLGSYLLGWFEMTLFEAAVRGWDYFAANVNDRIVPSLIVFGFSFPAPGRSFPEGETELAGISFTQASPSVCYGWDFGIIFIGVAARAEGTIGIGAYLNREVMATAETNPKCSATGAVVIDTQYCVKAFKVNRTVSAAAEACRNDSGWLAPAFSVAAATAIGQARTAAGITNPYLWVDGGASMSCVQLAAHLEGACDHMRDVALAMASRFTGSTRTELEQRAQQDYDSCLARGQRQVETCVRLRADMNLWRWRMPTLGSVATSGVPFAAGQPDDAGSGQYVLALHSSGQFYDMAKGASLPFVCMYPKSYAAGGKVSAVVEPYATLTLVGEASVSVAVASATLWVSVDLLTAALPLTGSVQWMSGTPFLTLATGTLEFVLRGLGGAIGATLWAIVVGEWTITIFDWDSIDYGRWTLGSLIPQWRSQ
jgi:hypothetical protein